MRSAVILGPRCSPKDLKPFQNSDATNEIIDWHIGLPAAADQADVILVFGGDGTIHRHLGQLVELGLPVLVVPTGSGNDFARALGLRRVRDSLAAWQRFCAGEGRVRTIDLGVIIPIEAANAPRDLPIGTRRYFCSVAGIGLDSEVTRRANALPRWLRSHGGYALALAPTIFRFAPFPMKIFTPDEPGGWSIRSDHPTLLAAFANTSTYGGGMKIAPGARCDDGQLDVCVIGGIDPFKLACMFPTVYFGRHLRIREVQCFRAKHARVETEVPFDVYADGEYVCCTPVELTAQHGALQVLTL
jgi:diacylglycerol kinase (ATP)